eukprot:GFYU01015737.1.p1 GENE.GFYU01015737.1~~GFYU01015737.1.p1  ORF type:complete len:1108 (-),score=233.50 GFYU01015737.1:71-3394(-)
MGNHTDELDRLQILVAFDSYLADRNANRSMAQEALVDTLEKIQHNFFSEFVTVAGLDRKAFEMLRAHCEDVASIVHTEFEKRMEQETSVSEGLSNVAIRFYRFARESRRAQYRKKIEYAISEHNKALSDSREAHMSELKRRLRQQQAEFEKVIKNTKGEHDNAVEYHKANLDELESTFKTQQEQMEVMKKDHEKMEEKYKKKYEDAMSILKAQMEDLETENVFYATKLQNVKVELDEQSEAAARAYQKKQQELEHLFTEFDKTRKELEKMEEKNRAQRAEIKDLREQLYEIDVLRDELSVANNNLAKAEREGAEIKANLEKKLAEEEAKHQHMLEMVQLQSGKDIEHQKAALEEEFKQKEEDLNKALRAQRAELELEMKLKAESDAKKSEMHQVRIDLEARAAEQGTQIVTLQEEREAFKRLYERLKDWLENRGVKEEETFNVNSDKVFKLTVAAKESTSEQSQDVVEGTIERHIDTVEQSKSVSEFGVTVTETPGSPASSKGRISPETVRSPSPVQEESEKEKEEPPQKPPKRKPIEQCDRKERHRRKHHEHHHDRKHKHHHRGHKSGRHGRSDRHSSDSQRDSSRSRRGSPLGGRHGYISSDDDGVDEDVLHDHPRSKNSNRLTSKLLRMRDRGLSTESGYSSASDASIFSQCSRGSLCSLRGAPRKKRPRAALTRTVYVQPPPPDPMTSVLKSRLAGTKDEIERLKKEISVYKMQMSAFNKIGLSPAGALNGGALNYEFKQMIKKLTHTFENVVTPDIDSKGQFNEHMLRVIYDQKMEEMKKAIDAQESEQLVTAERIKSLSEMSTQTMASAEEARALDRLNRHCSVCGRHRETSPHRESVEGVGSLSRPQSGQPPGRSGQHSLVDSRPPSGRSSPANVLIKRADGVVMPTGPVSQYHPMSMRARYETIDTRIDEHISKLPNVVIQNTRDAHVVDRPLSQRPGTAPHKTRANVIMPRPSSSSPALRGENSPQTQSPYSDLQYGFDVDDIDLAGNGDVMSPSVAPQQRPRPNTSHGPSRSPVGYATDYNSSIAASLLGRRPGTAAGVLPRRQERNHANSGHALQNYMSQSLSPSGDLGFLMSQVNTPTKGRTRSAKLPRPASSRA